MVAYQDKFFSKLQGAKTDGKGNLRGFVNYAVIKEFARENRAIIDLN